MSNRHHTSTYHKISITDFFPRIPKLPSDLKLVHWGPSYVSSSTIFFQALIFMSIRYHTSTYHKISIKDFFPRIPKLPSDLKSDHWMRSYDFFHHHFFSIARFYVKSPPYDYILKNINQRFFPQGFQNCPQI